MGHLSEENEALLPPVQQTASQTLPIAVAVAEGSEGKWDGSWLNCFGDCSETGLSSFALAYFLPCVAFGINMKRALLGNLWVHAVLYVVCFWLWKVAINTASWNMYVQCGMRTDLDVPADVDGHRKMLGAKPQLPEDASPECQASVNALLGAELMGVLFFVAGVVYAAHQRTLIRRQLGIAGCFLKDLALWCCCPCCALVQETRTLAVNNVHAGVWHGPTRFVVPMAAPAEVTKA